MCYVDLHFRPPVKLNYIVFRNYYTHSIRIQHRLLARDGWREVMGPKVLMQDPHLEADAQDCHCIDVLKDFDRQFDCSQVIHLRIFLQQPSPNWLSFSLHDIKCYTVVQAKPACVSSKPKSLSEGQMKEAWETLDVSPGIQDVVGEFLLTADEIRRNVLQTDATPQGVLISDLVKDDRTINFLA
jgi:hypothetical protein